MSSQSAVGYVHHKKERTATESETERRLLRRPTSKWPLEHEKIDSKVKDDGQPLSLLPLALSCSAMPPTVFRWAASTAGYPDTLVSAFLKYETAKLLDEGSR
jgi:hypothetical protein